MKNASCLMPRACCLLAAACCLLLLGSGCQSTAMKFGDTWFHDGSAAEDDAVDYLAVTMPGGASIKRLKVSKDQQGWLQTYTRWKAAPAVIEAIGTAAPPIFESAGDSIGSIISTAGGSP